MSAYYKYSTKSIAPTSGLASIGNITLGVITLDKSTASGAEMKTIVLEIQVIQEGSQKELETNRAKNQKYLTSTSRRSSFRHSHV